MAKHYSDVIDEIMPLVKDGDKYAPFVIYRNDNEGNGPWFAAYPYPGDNIGETIRQCRESDPYAAAYTGADFDGGSLPHVYDEILCDRLRGEHHDCAIDDSYSDADKKRLRGLINFFEDNVSAFSHTVTNYLTDIGEPFRELDKMCPYNLATDWQGWTFNEDLAADAVDAIENAVADKSSRLKDEPVQSNKRIISGYEEKQSTQVAGQLVILAENQKADEPYMVCYCKWDNPLGINEYYNVCVTDDYTEALGLYAHGILSFTRILEKEMSGYEQPPRVMAAADCIPNGLENDMTGKLIIIKSEVLSPEYRRSEHQLKHCTGGFGASPNSRGNAVYCKDLYSGKESRFERGDVLGIADAEKLPEWAKLKLAPPKQKSAQKPDFLAKINENKRKAERGNAANAGTPAKRKNRDGQEV